MSEISQVFERYLKKTENKRRSYRKSILFDKNFSKKGKLLLFVFTFFFRKDIKYRPNQKYLASIKN